MKDVQNKGLDKLPISQRVPTLSLPGKPGNYQSDFTRQFPLCLLPSPPLKKNLKKKINILEKESKTPKNSSWISKVTTF